MRITNIIKAAARAAVILVLAVGSAADMHAYTYIPNDTITIDGVLYRSDIYDDPIDYFDSGNDSEVIEWDMPYTLEAGAILYQRQAAGICDAVLDRGVLRFYDGSTIPTFRFAVLARPAHGERFTGEVWLQDSVPLKDLPNPRKMKYHYVTSLQNQQYSSFPKDLFGEELTFIRTPRYFRIYASMFKDCVNLRTARIGAAQTVRKNSFANCTKLETVIFESAPYVDNDAFINCPNIRRVVMESKLPLPLQNRKGYYEDDRSPFDQKVYEKATLYVKAELIEDFRKDKTWGKFLNIRDIQEYVSGVESVEADAEVEYQIYNMSGVQVRTAASGRDWREGLPPGLYLVRSSKGAVRKESLH